MSSILTGSSRHESINTAEHQVTMVISRVTLYECDWIIQDMNIYINETFAPHLRLEVRANETMITMQNTPNMIVYKTVFKQLVCHGGFNISLIKCTLSDPTVQKANFLQSLIGNSRESKNEPTGTLITISKSHLYILNSEFSLIKSTPHHGPVFFNATENCFISVQNSYFGNNTGYYGLMYIGNNSEIEVFNSTFIGNKAVSLDQVGGGCFKLVHNVSMEIKNCTFISNSASCGGVLGTGGSGFIYIHSSIFKHNHANHTITNSSKLNSAGGVINIYNQNQTIHLIQCTFLQNTAQLGGCISAVETCSHLNIEKCEFLKNSAMLIAGSIYTSLATANIMYSVFNGNTAGAKVLVHWLFHIVH